MNIHVTKLDIDTGGENLRQVFEEFGEVLFVKIITDKITGKSRGFRFVEMAYEEDGLEAIKELNDSELDRRSIVVKKGERRKTV